MTDASQQNRNYKIASDILQKCEYEISLVIESWKGVNLEKTTKSFDTFREYFAVAKNWWDQKKRHTLGEYLWVPILVDIKKVCI